RARYCAAWSYICPGLVRYACAPSHMPSASGRAELRTVRTTTRRAKIAARAQYNAGRVSTSTAARRTAPTIFYMANRKAKSLSPVRRSIPDLQGVEAPQRAAASVSEQKINQYRKRSYQALHSETDAANKRHAAGK